MSSRGPIPSKRRKQILVSIVLLLSVLCIGLIIGITVHSKTRQDGGPCVGSCLAANNLLQAVNFSADPCEDFFKYACGRWAETRPIPQYQNSVTVSGNIERAIYENLLRLLNRTMYVNNQDSKVIQSVLGYYDACLDLDTINKKSVETMSEFLNNTAYPPFINKQWNPKEYDFVATLAESWKLTGTSYVFDWKINIDSRNKSRTILYLKDNFSNQGVGQMLGKFKFFVLQILDLFVKAVLHTDDLLQVQVDEIVNLDSQFRKMLTPSNENRVERLSVKELSSKLPGIDWLKYLQLMTNDSLNRVDSVITENEIVEVADLGFVRKVIKFMEDDENARKVANSIGWNLMFAYIMFMPQQYQTFYHNYTTQYFNLETPRERSIHCLNELRKDFRLVIDHLYVTHFYKEEDSNAIQDMFNNTKNQYKSRIGKAEWLDESTKSTAQRKVDKMETFLGYPDYLADIKTIEEQYKDFSEFGTISDNALANVLLINRFNRFKIIEAIRDSTIILGQSTKYSSVDAFYDRNQNYVTITAGTVNPPYYTPGAPHYVNAGSFGTVIAHEFTHAFDVRGMGRNEFGELQDWWSTSAKKQYDERTNCFVKQYNGYEDVGLKLNGQRAVQENVADNVGIRVSYYTYKEWEKKYSTEPKLAGLEELTNDQIFFLAYASVHCRNINLDALQNEIQMDTYSPKRFRVNGALSNLREFASVFGCNNSSKMYNQNQCVLW